MRRTILGVVALALALTALVAPTNPAGAVVPTLPHPDSHGIRVPSGQLEEIGGNPRLVDVSLETDEIFRGGTNPAIADLTKEINVRILLPAGYDPDRAQPYEVLYLLHGGAADWQQWAADDQGDIEATVAGVFDGIVVMPEGGWSGWYSDWALETDGRFRPRWETFHNRQLVPWVDANFNTSGTRSGRYIAGVSMGGYGAMRYAGHFPELYAGVAALSGGFDLRQPGAVSRVANSMWFYGAAVNEWGTNPFLETVGGYRVNLQPGEQVVVQPGENALDVHRMETVAGPRSTWSTGNINPVDMADRGRYSTYSGTIALYSGQIDNGWRFWEGEEPEIGQWNVDFHNRLESRPTPVSTRLCQGPGGHDWDHWKDDLRDFLLYVHGSPQANCLGRADWGPAD